MYVCMDVCTGESKHCKRITQAIKLTQIKKAEDFAHFPNGLARNVLHSHYQNLVTWKS